MPSAGIGPRDANGEDRAAAEGGRRVRRVRGGQPAVTESAARSDDPGTDPAHDDGKSPRRGPRETGGNRDAGDVTVHASAHSDRDLDEPALLQRPHRVREGDRQRASGELQVRDTLALADPRAHRRDLAVEGAADDRHLAEGGREPALLLRMQRGDL